MRRRLWARGDGVLEKCFRRATGEGAELGDQVRLVGEAARERELVPAHAAGEGARAFEAQQPRRRLRRQPDLLAEARDQALPAPAQLAGERARAPDRACAAAGPKPRPPRARPEARPRAAAPEPRR